eukprot:GEMP01099085.1.p1 GENE.GEMP01099085.1~~GEMP01099085.1.p1  ORF type:complete len:227 (+),score=30.13 GEMP01099085.1:38-718(+)
MSIALNSSSIKLATGEFDLKTIFTLILTAKGIDRLQNLDELESLRWLDLSKNHIIRIESLLNLQTLQFLDLSFNKIQKVHGLDSCCALQTLKLNANPISRLQDLMGLTGPSSLTHLTLQNLDGTDPCPVCLQGGYKYTIYELVPRLVALDGRRKNLPDFDPLNDMPLQLPEVPAWEQDISINGILNPEMVESRLQPLMDDFEQKASDCRTYLQEGSALLQNLIPLG